MIFPGNGDGTFGEPETIGLGFPASALRIADIDGDSHPDVLATAYNFLVLMRGLGNGAFQSPQTYVAGSPWDLAVDDFDGNGSLDVVAKQQRLGDGRADAAHQRKPRRRGSEYERARRGRRQS